MPNRVKNSLEVKIKRVEIFLSRKHQICKIQKNGANGDKIYRWVRTFQHNGIDGLKWSNDWKRLKY